MKSFKLKTLPKEREPLAKDIGPEKLHVTTEHPPLSEADPLPKAVVGGYTYQYHSTELKARILYIFLSLTLGFILCFKQSEYLLYKVTSSLLPGTNGLVEFTLESDGASANPSGSGFIFTELLEGFWSTLLLAGYGALILSSPIIYYHIYKFLLPGLTYLETRFLKTFLFLSLSFLILTHLLTYYLILPYAASFFLSFQSNYPLSGFLHFTGRIYPALTFILNVSTLLSFLFQLPLLLFSFYLYNLSSHLSESFWAKPGLESTHFQTPQPLPKTKESTSATHRVTASFFAASQSKTFLRKLLFFTLVLLTAIFSPPDIYSQLFLFVPLFFILEIFILMIFVFKESPYAKTPTENKM